MGINLFHAAAISQFFSAQRAQYEGIYPVVRHMFNFGIQR